MNKIEALRTAAKAIREGHFYDWKKPHSCNCGIVAQVVLGMDTITAKTALALSIYAAKQAGVEGVTWIEMSSVLCPITGIPTDTIFRALHEAGFNRADLVALEVLSDPEVCRRANLTKREGVKEKKETIKTGWFSKEERVTQAEVKGHYEIAKNAAAYMEAWADILEEKSKEEELAPNLQEVADRLMAKK